MPRISINIVISINIGYWSEITTALHVQVYYSCLMTTAEIGQ